MISLQLTSRSEALRFEFQKWLKENPPPDHKGKLHLKDFVEISSEWQRTLAQAGWVAVHWPEEYGGRGLSLLEEAVIQECLAQVRAPQLVNLFGITMVGPVLIAYGTSAQKERYLKKILLAEEIWCQGFSEPEAGSDLAAVRTTALAHTDGWRIQGQKVWTSFAQYAHWCFVLVRTNANAKKHEGLSYLLVPMTASGIEVRPLTQISGDSEFNEVFFNETLTDLGNIVGNPGDGWKIAIDTLMYERVILTFARHLQSEVALSEIIRLLRQQGASDINLASLGSLSARSLALRAMALSHLRDYDHKMPGPEGSLDKLAWSETFQDICAFALELEGLYGLATAGSIAVEEGASLHRYLYSRGRTIAAGTSEVQRNIIAERVLGLPRGDKSV